MLAVVLVAAVLATLAIRREYSAQLEHAQARLRTLSDLRAERVERWLESRMSLAYFMDDSAQFAQLFNRWRDDADEAAGRALLTRASEFRAAIDSDLALLIDAAGQVVARERGTTRGNNEILMDGMKTAIAQGHSVHTAIYRRPGADLPVRMDVIIPLLKSGTPARGGVVLRFDAKRALFPLLSSARVASDSSESMLWGRSGDNVVSLSDTARGPVSDPSIVQPIATSRSGLARVLRNEAAAGQIFESLDARDNQVLALVVPIKGTDWWMSSQLDLAEVDRAVLSTAQWIVALALSIILVVMVASRWLLQRNVLARSREEHAAQEERVKTLSLLQAVADSASESIYAKDLDGRYIFCNRAAALTVGRTSDEVVGKRNHDIFDPQTAAMIGAQDLRAMAGESMEMVEDVNPIGAPGFTSLTTKGPLRDSDGRVIGIIGVSRDITRSQRAERALRESEAHYRSVVSVLSEGVFAFDAKGRVLNCNPAAERILGVKSAELVGVDKVLIGWQPVDATGARVSFGALPVARVLRGEPAQPAELVRVLKPGGQACMFEVSASPVISPDTGALISVVASFVDVTERKQLDAELERHRHQLETLVAERTRELESAARFNRDITDATPARVAYWDADLRCRFANLAYAQGIFTTPEEMIGRSVDEIYREYAGLVRPGLETALSGRQMRFIRERQHPDGSPFIQEVHYIPQRRPEGSTSGIYVMAFDVTALKQAESRLQTANDELEAARDAADAASRAKSAFLANMSHEIRTPMSAIIGLTHLMSRDITDPLQHSRVTKVGDAAQHLLQVINDILDLSKIEAGKLVLYDEEFLLEAVLEKAVQMVSGRARDKGLELILDPDHVPMRLRGDAIRLSQILINLMSNAVKFTQEGWVRIRCSTLVEQAHDLKIRFEVQDTGPGLSTERQAMLFRAFEQGDNSISREHGGTGLGLALSKQLALAMGGEAGVISSPGAGSTFWFTAWVGRAATDPPREESSGTLPLRALLVDDLPESLIVIGERLEILGLSVDSFASGAAAVAHVEAELSAGRPYDVMLIDWRMAPLDGIDTLRHLRASLGDGTPPSILVTASDDPLVRDLAAQVRFDAVMSKPITTSALQGTLASVLGKRGSLAPGPVAESSEAESLLKSRHAGQRILLAEDNPVNREVAEELLGSAGLIVETAEDGAQAVKLAFSRRYDLILMDMQMPVLDGLEATLAIRQRDAGATPIIAMTANAFAEDRAACLAAGMNDHVAKPVNPATLYGMLLRWLPLRERARNKLVSAAPLGASKSGSESLGERLAAVAGLDLDEALKNVAGQRPALVRMLQRFASTYAAGAPVLLTVREGDVETRARLRTACHSLRGAFATVGAAEVQRQLAALEQALSQGLAVSVLEPMALEVHASLLRLVEQLRSALDD